jgi:hypothetical protein
MQYFCWKEMQNEQRWRLIVLHGILTATRQRSTPGMKADDFEKRRRRLSRDYTFEAELRAERFANQSSTRTARFLRHLTRRLERQTLPHYAFAPPRWRMRLRARFGGTRTLPDFCVVGAPKSGTTDLAVSLMVHPNVIAPFAKEFWHHNPETWRIFYPTENEKKRHARLHGVALSPYCVPNLHAFEAPIYLSRKRPNTKVIIVLREPADRSYSQWKWEVLLAGPGRAGAHPFLGTFRRYIDAALELFPDDVMPSMCGYPALQTSIYWRRVAHWINCFGRDNVLVLNIADYFQDRNRCLQKIQNFVGLPYVALPPFAKKINENPIRLPAPDNESVAKLRDFYKPYNEKLWAVIGEEYAW